MNGEIKIINNEDINFSYRKSSLTKNQIITNIEMKGSFLKKDKVIEIMRNLKNKKRLSNHRKLKQEVVPLKIRGIQIKKLGN